MLEIRTQVDIGASASLVWGILTDFGSYRRWNPYMRSVSGQSQVGNSIEITQDVVAFGASTFRATVTHVREPRELRWFGRWAIPGLYSAEHRFAIESLQTGGVRLHNGEVYRGVALPLAQRRLQQIIEPAFVAMNLALKRRAERAEEPREAAAEDSRQYADQDRRS
jgi:hypothetical protein